MATATATGGAPSPITGRAKSNYATVIKRIKSKVFHFSFATFYDLPAWSNGRSKVCNYIGPRSKSGLCQFFFSKRKSYFGLVLHFKVPVSSSILIGVDN